MRTRTSSRTNTEEHGSGTSGRSSATLLRVSQIFTAPNRIRATSRLLACWMASVASMSFIGWMLEVLKQFVRLIKLKVDCGRELSPSRFRRSSSLTAASRLNRRASAHLLRVTPRGLPCRRPSMRDTQPIVLRPRLAASNSLRGKMPPVTNAISAWASRTEGVSPARSARGIPRAEVLAGEPRQGARPLIQQRGDRRLQVSRLFQ